MIKLEGDMAKALSISGWLRDQGYYYGRDFEWHFESTYDTFSPRKIVVRCYYKPELETYILLRWT